MQAKHPLMLLDLQHLLEWTKSFGKLSISSQITPNIVQSTRLTEFVLSLVIYPHVSTTATQVHVAFLCPNKAISKSFQHRPCKPKLNIAPEDTRVIENTSLKSNGDIHGRTNSLPGLFCFDVLQKFVINGLGNEFCARTNEVRYLSSGGENQCFVPCERLYYAHVTATVSTYCTPGPSKNGPTSRIIPLMNDVCVVWLW